MERYAIGGGRQGYERLRVLAAAHGPGTLELLRLAGLRSGARCADLGCGGGDVTFEMAALAGPAGWAVGIDSDPVQVELARETARERSLVNVTFEVGDVNQWQGVGQYDFVYCRFLCQHLARPVDLLHRMWQAVRPGGALAVEDADLEGLFCDPDNDGFSFYQRSYLEVVARIGGNPGCARRLARYFREIGIPDPQMRMLQGIHADGAAKLMPLVTLEAIEDSVVSAGAADRGQVARAIKDLAAFTADPGTMVADPRIFQVWARRGVGDGAVS